MFPGLSGIHRGACESLQVLRQRGGVGAGSRVVGGDAVGCISSLKSSVVCAQGGRLCSHGKVEHRRYSVRSRL